MSRRNDIPNANEGSGVAGSSLDHQLDWSDPEGARAHLAAIIESSEDAIVSKTLDGIVTSWNRAAERLFGFPAAEMLGQSILRVIPPELHYEETEILAKLRRGERIERYETVRVHKDGHRLEISLTISPVRGSRGRIVGAAKIAHDIGARRGAERALREEALALETLNRVGQAVAAQLDLERVAELVADAATELTGAAFGAFFYTVTNALQEPDWVYTLSGVLPEQLTHFPVPQDSELFAATLKGQEIVRLDDICQDPRYTGVAAGHPPVRSYLAVPVSLPSNEVVGGLFLGHSKAGVFNERAERLVVAIAAQASIATFNARLFKSVRERGESERAARSEAERLSHMKDEFLAMLSHELRTPLNAILGWSTLLRRPDVKQQDLQRGLETIDRNVRAQTQIVNDLLDMSRIVSGKIQLEVQALSLQDVIDNAIETVRPSANAKRIRLQATSDPRVGTQRGDPNRMQQVLWNLLSNAVKFTPSGGRIQVSLRRVNSHVEIVVEDSGVGIPADFLPYVFDRFRQADPSRTRQYGGLGLGLSIVKTLVELHGGSVHVTSPGENQGSTFTVTLPCLPVPEEESAQNEDAVSEPLGSLAAPRLDGVRVLVVDDEPDGRSLIARILDGSGAQATCVATARQALDLLQRNRYDVLLSDIGMPAIDGYELIQRIRQLDSGRVPAIALTAYARAEDRQRSLLAGYHMHLSKPIEPAELVAGIASLLSLKR